MARPRVPSSAAFGGPEDDVEENLREGPSNRHATLLHCIPVTDAIDAHEEYVHDGCENLRFREDHAALKGLCRRDEESMCTLLATDCNE